MASPEDRLKELGITLPEVAAPVANYVAAVQTGNLLFLSGQVPMLEGKVVYTGKVGGEATEQQGTEAARLCAINLLAQAKKALGDLSRIKRLVKLTIFVASTPDFTRQPFVANGASDLMVDVFGDAGRHARVAVGTNVLPLDSTVEVDAIFEIA